MNPNADFNPEEEFVPEVPDAPLSGPEPSQPERERTEVKGPAIPHDSIAEQVVLSTMLQHPLEAIPRLERILRAEDFYEAESRGLIFTALCALYDAGTPVSIFTLYRELADRKQLDRTGGPGEIATLHCFKELQDFSASVLELDWHVEKLLEASRRRYALSTSQELQKQAYDGDVDLDAAAGKFLALAKSRPAIGPHSQPQVLRHFALEAVEAIDAANSGEKQGWPTGLRHLDAMLGGGLKGHSYTVIAARPSIGKTSLAMQALWEINHDLDVPVAAISLETHGVGLAKRLISTVSGIPLTTLLRGGLTPKELKTMEDAVRQIADATTFRLYDPPTLDCNGLRSTVRQLVNEFGCRVIMVDYLQLIMNSVYTNSRELDRVSEVSRTFKSLSLEHDACFLVISQLRRIGDKTPGMEDARSSGQIEQDADVMILLSESDDVTDAAEEITLNARIAKQKEGAKGDVPITFHRSTFRFSTCHKPQP